jgi:AIPR protein
MFTLIDGSIVNEKVSTESVRRNPKFELVIVTVNRSDSFKQTPIDKLITSLSELLDLTKTAGGLTYPFNEEILSQRAIFRKLYVSLADRRPSLSITVNYCCRGDSSKINDNINGRARQLEEQIRVLFGDICESVNLLGASEILEIARRQRSYTLRLKFVENFISRERTNYVVLSTLPNYLDFITDEQGNLRRYLFESNVRDYLGGGQINRDIYSTLISHEKSAEGDFWWFNNGITLLASYATIAGKDLNLENVQIVNGLQTTETIYNYFKGGGDVKDDRAILIKILLVNDDTVRDRIIKATNYQSSVELSSLRGTDKIQRDIEHFLLDHGWFYDRRKNYYKNQGKPGFRIISMPYLASAVRAIALKDPSKSRVRRSRSLKEDKQYHEVFNPKWDLRVFLVCLEITRAIEEALNVKRSWVYAPPIALTHFIGYAYACIKLGTIKYRPEMLIKLASIPPTIPEAMDIRNQLKAYSVNYSGPEKNIREFP